MFRHTAELYDMLYSFKDYAREAERLRALVGARVRTANVRLLDVACGTGAHLEQLRTSYSVEGIELDEGMLAVARRRLSGVRLHQGDMLDFHLARRFDVVTCLFSSIGYVRSVPRLRQAVWNMAAHLAPGGILIVEPWFFPKTYRPGRPSVLMAQRDEVAVARACVAGIEGGVSVLAMHYLVATRGERVEQFEERHELGLFIREEYESALIDCGLDVEFDATGLTGRGLFIAKARVPALARTTYLPRPERAALRARRAAGLGLQVC
ncbi:MAG: class I SAM-dependent methyltransferase [Gemmatimonadota bacterium]|nr:class I SAM-dependent methyltransferase [Gemmatimonadota bacterium]